MLFVWSKPAQGSDTFLLVEKELFETKGGFSMVTQNSGVLYTFTFDLQVDEEGDLFIDPITKTVVPLQHHVLRNDGVFVFAIPRAGGSGPNNGKNINMAYVVVPTEGCQCPPCDGENGGGLYGCGGCVNEDCVCDECEPCWCCDCEEICERCGLCTDCEDDGCDGYLSDDKNCDHRSCICKLSTGTGITAYGLQLSGEKTSGPGTSYFSVVELDVAELNKPGGFQVINFIDNDNGNQKSFTNYGRAWLYVKDGQLNMFIDGTARTGRFDMYSTLNGLNSNSLNSNGVNITVGGNQVELRARQNSQAPWKQWNADVKYLYITIGGYLYYDPIDTYNPGYLPF